MSKKAVEFLARHGIEPEKMDVKAVCEDMVGHMRAGLDGNVRSMLMIPTYLSNDGAVPKGVSAAANGKATKIIIPSEIQSVAGLASGLIESVKNDVKAE